MPVFTTDDLRPHIGNVIDTLYSITKVVLDLDIPIELWEKYYAHVKFHDTRCVHCTDCIMNVCRDACIAQDPDFSEWILDVVSHVMDLEDLLFTRMLAQDVVKKQTP